LASFLALYRGETIGSARIVALATEGDLVRNFAERMLACDREDSESDAVLRELERGRRRALQLVKDETRA
jgi:hypothetical protein